MITLAQTDVHKSFDYEFSTILDWRSDEAKLNSGLKDRNRDVDLLELTGKLNPHKLEIVREIADMEKLKEYQRAFCDDVSNPQKAYLYLRVIGFFYSLLIPSAGTQSKARVLYSGATLRAA